MDQAWFEMREVRKRDINRAVWIPLLSVDTISKSGTVGHLGYAEEIFGAGSALIPLADKAKAEQLGWDDIGIRHDHRGYVEDGVYVISDHFDGWRQGVSGEYPVLKQHFNRDEVSEWHLHQDIAVTLGLMREGDEWVRPSEDYIVVARLKRNDKRHPVLLEIRASHLRDYLCARKMGLCITSYRSRTAVLEDVSTIKWSENPSQDTTPSAKWRGSYSDIHEGGNPFGEGVRVIHISRTDVDPEEDVPSMDLPGEDSVVSKSWTREFEGRKLHRVVGELWRTDWIDPAPLSPIVRYDEVPPTVFFTVDAEGNKESRETLVDGEGRWLWFRSDVINALIDRRGGSLRWYTRDTGDVRCSPDYSVHFGVNSLGLVTVYAKDIGLLPDWQQRIWAGYNIAPEGGVSRELLASQVDAMPADTQAPEAYLNEGLRYLEAVSESAYGSSFVRRHEKMGEILDRIHRFRATSQEGLFALAKDVARVTADSFDIAAMQTVVKPQSGTKWGSLKSLENVVATKIGAAKAHELMGPLFHIYDLRLADAHIPSEDAQKSMESLGIAPDTPFVAQGLRLLNMCVACLYQICQVLEAKDDSDVSEMQRKSTRADSSLLKALYVGGPRPDASHPSAR